MAKVQISLDDELLERIDFYAKKTYATRSGLIARVLVEFLDEKEPKLKERLERLYRATDIPCSQLPSV